ncbi:hypothetical protein RJT34_18790 [Clitoria ternatea]|uniref:Uncharacterized protein n=1 Tax=Clitoria ternatea TaxID=43366 RepID=A0AAN9JD05_CLITE
MGTLALEPQLSILAWADWTLAYVRWVTAWSGSSSSDAPLICCACERLSTQDVHSHIGILLQFWFSVFRGDRIQLQLQLCFIRKRLRKQDVGYSKAQEHSPWLLRIEAFLYCC